MEAIEVNYILIGGVTVFFKIILRTFYSITIDM